MVYVMLVMMVMSSIAFVTLVSIQNEQSTSSTRTIREQAFQAAEAGIDDYMAKMKDDPQYYAHYVHAAESTRTDLPSGTTVAAAGTEFACTASSKPVGVVWTFGTVLAAAAGGSPAGNPEWTYQTSPDHKDRWCQTSNGYEYNLEVTPPVSKAITGHDPTLTIVATGRQHLEGVADSARTDQKNWRVVQQVLSPNSIVRYYRVVNTNVTFAPETVTNGYVFANGNITHQGTATADLYAGGSITISPSSPGVGLTNGAQTHPNYTPLINFSSLLGSLTDISRAAQVVQPGNTLDTYFDDTTRDAWKLVFASNGTFTAQACDQNGGNAVWIQYPTTNCTTSQTFTVPANGAIYSPQDVIVSGTVKGRVTVASNSDIIVGGPINPLTGGSDVIGLNALNTVYVAQYSAASGADLTWNAAVIAQTDTWKDVGSVTHGAMIFRGMTVTNGGGSFGTFPDAHDYGYDTNLTFLIPPWFPSLVKPWTTTLFRELPAG